MDSLSPRTLCVSLLSEYWCQWWKRNASLWSLWSSFLCLLHVGWDEWQPKQWSTSPPLCNTVSGSRSYNKWVAAGSCSYRSSLPLGCRLCPGQAPPVVCWERTEPCTQHFAASHRTCSLWLSGLGSCRNLHCFYQAQGSCHLSNQSNCSAPVCIHG